MSLSREIGGATERFKVYIDRLVTLFKRHNVNSIASLVQAVRRDRQFSTEWKKTWREVADADGGKLSLTSVGLVLGGAMGGVGIAAAGGAIGLPLAFVLGLGGLLAGAELDALRRTSESRLALVRIPKEVHSRIRDAAETAGISINEAIVQALIAAFPNPDALDREE